MDLISIVLQSLLGKAIDLVWEWIPSRRMERGKKIINLEDLKSISVGSQEHFFDVYISNCGNHSVYCYNDSETIDEIGTSITTKIREIKSSKYSERSDRIVQPSIGSVVIVKNIHNYYAAIKFKNITQNDIEINYCILKDQTCNFS